MSISRAISVLFLGGLILLGFSNFIDYISKNNIKLNPLPRNAVVLALGDSLTSGYGVKRSQAYPEELQKISGFNVINAGVSGNTTSQALQRLPGLLSKYSPDLVLICIGGNDFLRKLDKDITKANISKMLSLILSSGSQAILIAVPLPGVILSAPKMYSALGDEFKVPVLEGILSGLLADAQYKSDALHLNELGYRTLAEDIYEFIQERGGVTTSYAR